MRVKAGKLSKLSDVILASGFILLTLGGSAYLASHRATQRLTLNQTALTLSDRQMAIKQAEANNSKTYSFQTNFIPGIGRVANPAQYQTEWEQQAKKAIDKTQ